MACLTACTASGPSPAPTLEATLTVVPTASPIADASPAHSASASGGVATTSTGGCRLDATSADWAPVAADPRRCLVAVFDPPMSFDSSPGWLWAGGPDRWAMTRDNGYFTELSTYRYGGAVVPSYCEDPPATVAMSAASDIVAWLETVPGLEVRVVARSVDSNPAWELDIAAPGVKSCSGDPGKAGLASLWTIDGQPVTLPESLSNTESMRVYLVELPSQIVIMTARTNPIDDTPGIPDNTDFWLRADEIFRSLVFE